MLEAQHMHPINPSAPFRKLVYAKVATGATAELSKYACPSEWRSLQKAGIRNFTVSVTARQRMEIVFEVEGMDMKGIDMKLRSSLGSSRNPASRHTSGLHSV